jgi:SH3-like domain-containing protein
MGRLTLFGMELVRMTGGWRAAAASGPAELAREGPQRQSLGCLPERRPEYKARRLPSSAAIGWAFRLGGLVAAVSLAQIAGGDSRLGPGKVEERRQAMLIGNDFRALITLAAGLWLALALAGGGQVLAETGRVRADGTYLQLAQAGPAATGTNVPRFASLKADRVHLRQGPGTDHKVLWVYRRAGLPIEILNEFEGWRQVRDAEGAVGWVLHSLLSARRTALVLPWEIKNGTGPQVPLLADDRESAAKVALVEAGVLANVRSCDGAWCYVSVGDFRGYIQQKKLWGVYDGESVR